MLDPIERTTPDMPFTWTEPQELDAYRTMLLIRRFEEKAAQLYAVGEIAELTPLSIGQEAVATGIALAAKSGDIVLAGPRPHGVLLARGAPADQLMAAVLTGHSSRSIQHGGPASNTLAVNGADPKTYRQILDRTLEGLDRMHAAVWCLGDGRDHQDDLFQLIESARLAKRPVVFVIENASDVPAAGICTAQASSLSRRCEAAGFPAARVGGLDVRHVKSAIERAIVSAQSGGGSSIVEIMTYRYRGHSSMPGNTVQSRRPREETDPVAMARARIAGMGDPVTAQRLKDIEHAVRASVTAALTAARVMSKAA